MIGIMLRDRALAGPFPMHDVCGVMTSVEIAMAEG